MLQIGESAASNRPSGRNVWRRVSPRVVALGYVTLASLWIALSDFLVASLGTGSLAIEVSVSKGFLFVAVTGIALYVVLERRERWLRAADTGIARWITPASEGVKPERIRVLVIADDAEERVQIRDVLTRASGIEVEIDEAATALEGRDAILRQEHDAILVDQRLAGTNPLVLIRELAGLASGPLILLAGFDDPAVDQAALAAGAHDSIPKIYLDAPWLGRMLRHSVTTWRAQRELARTGEWYSQMVDQVPVGLFRSTPEGSGVEANPALLAMFGMSSMEEYAATPIASLYRNPDERRAVVDRVLTDHSIEDVDVEMQRVDGTPLMVRLRMRGIFDSTGLKALYGAATDVTALLGNESQMRLQASMLDEVRNAVIAADQEGIVTFWNRWAEHEFGWSAAEAVGRSVLDVTAPEESHDLGRQIMATIDKDGGWEGEFTCQRKDGSTFPAFVSDTQLRTATGNSLGLVGVITNLTEIRKAEEQARTERAMASSVLESVGFPAVVIDDRGVIIAANGAWDASAIANDTDPAAVGVGIGYLEVCDRATGVEDAIIVGDAMRAVLTGRLDRATHEYPCGPMWFRVEMSRSVPPLAGAVVMHIDITELREATMRAQDFARSKDRLIAAVSHELRTPLTAVLGFADLIKNPRGLAGEEFQGFAADIHRQATDMAALVDDLLVAARSEMGVLSIQAVPVDIASEIEGVVAHLQTQERVSLENRMQPVGRVLADPLRVRQILRNLITNAVRYGGPSIVIETADRTDVVDVRVSDNGEGIPPHLAEEIFTPFFSAHDRTGQPDALGLGLSVVQTLARAMAGDVTHTADTGWTVFTLTLPKA